MPQQAIEIPEIDELVINWHLTEACNFQCSYCFSAWEKPGTGAELWRSGDRARCLLEALHSFFHPSNLSNPLRDSIRWRSLRLSLAGGEPTLLRGHLVDIAVHAKQLGFGGVSLITNGSRPKFLGDLARHIDMLGISVDSVREATNAAIGRASRGGISLSADDIIAVVESERASNPSVIIKINTVVNALNVGEDLSDFILRVRPQRWKVMRMLPSVTDNTSIESGEFRTFVARHHGFRSMMTVEDNVDMGRSYIMIDPHGRFFQNAPDRRGYDYSLPIVEIGAEMAFRQIAFSPSKFAARYQSGHSRVSAS
jgi:radical S-adenosyl methionine domain-containing protein 2